MEIVSENYTIRISVPQSPAFLHQFYFFLTVLKYYREDNKAEQNKLRRTSQILDKLEAFTKVQPIADRELLCQNIIPTLRIPLFVAD